MKKPFLKKVMSICLTALLVMTLGIYFPIYTQAAGFSFYASSEEIAVNQQVTVTVSFYGEGLYYASGYIYIVKEQLQGRLSHLLSMTVQVLHIQHHILQQAKV